MRTATRPGRLRRAARTWANVQESVGGCHGLRAREYGPHVSRPLKSPVVLLLTMALSLAVSAPGADAASFKRCGTFPVYGGGKARYQAKGVSCRAAKKVLRSASLTLCFDNPIPGWKKQWRALPNGGRALTLTKGAKAIRTDACSPK